MTLKEIKTKYKVSKWENGKFFIYHLTENGKRIPPKYLCYINKKNDTSFYVDGCKPTTKLDVLCKQIEDHVKALPYDSEYYMPSYRKGLFEEFIIYDYMREIGFSNNHGWNSDKRGEWYYDRESIYEYNTTQIGISFYGLGNDFGRNMDDIPEEVTISLHTGQYSWVSVKAKRNPEDIINAINALLKPLLISEAAGNILSSEKIEIGKDVEILMEKISGYSVESEDVKKELKRKLIEVANSL